MVAIVLGCTGARGWGLTAQKQRAAEGIAASLVEVMLLEVGSDQAIDLLGQLEQEGLDFGLRRCHELEEAELVLGTVVDEDAVHGEHVKDKDSSSQPMALALRSCQARTTPR